MPITAKGHKMLAAFHGLDPEKNNDDDVAESIRNAVKPEEVKDFKNRAETAEAQLIEQDLTKYAGRIGKKTEFWKQALVSNRATALEALEALPEAIATNPNAGKQPMHNRATAQNPSPVDAPDKTAAEATKLNSLIKNRAEKLQAGGTSRMTAHIQANKEIHEELAAGMHK